jgi:hypothetical protein
MSIPLNTIKSAVPTVCRMLRTKTAYGAYDEEGMPTPWQAGESTTAVFWCLETMETAGPDDGFAHPTMCQAGRRCYASEDV